MSSRSPSRPSESWGALRASAVLALKVWGRSREAATAPEENPESVRGGILGGVLGVRRSGVARTGCQSHQEQCHAEVGCHASGRFRSSREHELDPGLEDSPQPADGFSCSSSQGQRVQDALCDGGPAGGVERGRQLSVVDGLP